MHDFRGPDGERLERYGCPKTGKIWLCQRDQPDFYCWEVERPAYVAPAVGVSQAAADFHAATEIANRAALEADLARAKAQSMEMRATAFSETAAEKADISYAEAQAALETAACNAKDSREAYQKAAALADSDASHRAARQDIAPGIAPPAVVATASAATDIVQAFRDSSDGGGGTGASPTRARPSTTTVIGRLGQMVACYAHTGAPPRTGNPPQQERRRRKQPDASGK